MAGKHLKPTFVRAGVRADGTAVAAHQSHRITGRGKPASGKAADPKGLRVGLAGSADEPTWWPTPDDWHGLIEDGNNDDVTDVNSPFRLDGTLHIGKRYVSAVVEHEITYLDDDVATPQIEDRTGVVTSREKYRIAVPDGAGVNYNSVADALRKASTEEFSDHLKSGMYKNVKIGSIVLQEWEVIDTPDPDKAWRLRRDLWDDGELTHNR